MAKFLLFLETHSDTSVKRAMQVVYWVEGWVTMLLGEESSTEYDYEKEERMSLGQVFVSVLRCYIIPSVC
jgi:hypothetical protein